jgi:hypothetical protein
MIDADELDEDTEDAIQAWKEADLYVFICWGQDFDINSQGEVVST